MNKNSLRTRISTKTILIKLTLDNIFIKVKNSTRAAPPSQKLKTNLKTLISPLLTPLQGPQLDPGVSKEAPLSTKQAIFGLVH